MITRKQFHPEMAGLVEPRHFIGVGNYRTAHAHAFQVEDGLRKHRKTLGRHTMWTAGQALAFGNSELVVDPAVLGVERPAIRIIGRDRHIVWTGRAFEILKTPRITLENRHL